MPSICSECGNIHFGPCATQETYFVYEPDQNAIPQQVLIAGSWKKWQTLDKLNREVNEHGQVFFRRSLTLHAGTYEYKYVIDGEWKFDPTQPVVDDQHGSFNNFIKVYPKKKYLPISKDGQIKITTNFLIEGIKLIGSWDNWNKQITMMRVTNHLLNKDEYEAYVHVEPNTQYEFKFKLNKQYIIDQKYPTTANELGSQNNIIITSFFEEDFKKDSGKKDFNETPSKVQSAHPKNIKKDFNCKSFEWVAVSRTFELPYRRVEGHNMVAIGDYIYIFGGFCRSEYYNSLTKINILLTSARSQQALPEGRAFHSMVNYGNKMIIYGGHNAAILQNYYSFNVSQQKWVAVPHIQGKYPQKVEKQSCVLYQSLMVFFGGYYCSQDFQYEAYYNQIHVLDIQNMKWIDQIQVLGQKPKGRFAHTAALMGSDMYIFGGIYNAAQNLHLNDIWKINLSKTNELYWQELKPKGKKPRPRHGHTMTALHQYLVIFGGNGDEGNYFNDVFIFNTNDNEWFQPMIIGEVPRPRYNHAACTVIQNDQIIVFGGRTKDHNFIETIYILKPYEKITALNINEIDDQ